MFVPDTLLVSGSRLRALAGRFVDLVEGARWRALRTYRRRLTRDGRRLARRLEGCRP